MAYKHLVKEGIDAIVLIGGDGTFTGGMIFNQEFNFPVIGIPGTIDNDILGTNFTLGYDTALNTAVEAIDKIRDTASSHKRLFFVEVMGRDVGHIALNAGVGSGAEEILVPEENLGLDRLLESLQKSRKTIPKYCEQIVPKHYVKYSIPKDKINSLHFVLFIFVKIAPCTILYPCMTGSVPLTLSIF